MEPYSPSHKRALSISRTLGKLGFITWVGVVASVAVLQTSCGDGYTKYLDGPQLIAFVGRPDSANNPGAVDGYGTSSAFNIPAALAVDSSGNIYVADQGNHTIRKVTPTRIVSTFAGTAGSLDATNGTGADARFKFPSGVAVDKAGNVYIADTENHLVRKISPSAEVTTFAGRSGVQGSIDGAGTDATFNNPVGLAVDSGGNIFVADYGNRIIRKISPDGEVSTIAGLAGNLGASDGAGSNARFANPFGLAIDRADNLYVSDVGNLLIRKITPSGDVSTLAGTTDLSRATDGVGTDAAFLDPRGMAFDDAGILYVADNYRIRKITPEGAVSTFVGSSEEKVFSPGTVPSKIFGAVGVAVWGDRLYIAASNGIAAVLQIR